MTVKLSEKEIWDATNYEPNGKKPLTLQDGERVALEAQRKLFRELESDSCECEDGWTVGRGTWDSIKKELGIK